MELAKETRKCFRCDYEWIPRKKTTKTCARCRTPRWNIELNQKCRICKRMVLYPHNHHVNGNTKDNSKGNTLLICEDCHKAIHTGIGRQKGGARGWKGKRRNYGKWRGKHGELKTIKKLEFYQNQLWLGRKELTK